MARLYIILGEFLLKFSFSIPLLLGPLVMSELEFNEVVKFYSLHVLWFSFSPTSLHDLLYDEGNKHDKDRLQNELFSGSMLIIVFSIVFLVIFRADLYVFAASLFGVFRSVYSSIQLRNQLEINHRNHLIVSTIILVMLSLWSLSFLKSLSWVYWSIIIISIFGLLFAALFYFQLSRNFTLFGKTKLTVYSKLLFGWIGGYGLTFIYSTGLKNSELYTVNSLIAIWGLLSLVIGVYVNLFLDRLKKGERKQFKSAILPLYGLIFIGVIFVRVFPNIDFHPYFLVLRENYLLFYLFSVLGITSIVLQVELQIKSEHLHNLIIVAGSVIIGLPIIFLILDSFPRLGLASLVVIVSLKNFGYFLQKRLWPK